MNQKPNLIKRFWQQLGPGLTTGAADDDPSGVATYAQTGTQTGFQMLWTPFFTWPLMAIIQEACARIGLVTGRGLAANIRLHFPRPVLWLCTGLLFSANTLNIAADLAAMAAATRLLTPQVPFWGAVIGWAAIIIVVQVALPYRQVSRVLKWLALVLLAYVLTAFAVRDVAWSQVWSSVWMPHLEFNRETILLLCAILGTTISPYLFFWQTSQEVEEEILAGKKSVKARQQAVSGGVIRRMRWDVWLGMAFSNAVMFFIILTSAAVLRPAGIDTIATAEQAAEALAPLAGQWASVLFAVGIIGVGMLAIPVLAGSAAYAAAESFRWREGLYRRLRDAWAFYAVIIASVILGIVITAAGLDPIRGLVIAAMVNGIVAPIILILIMRLSDRRSILGRHANSVGTSIAGWALTALMCAVALASLIAMLRS